MVVLEAMVGVVASAADLVVDLVMAEAMDPADMVDQVD